jgi:glycosyltransferase involved in cell wall biosynthesis
MLLDQSVLLTVVVQVYNEQEVLLEFAARLKAVMETLDCEYEVLYVNDGSSDNSLNIITTMSNKDKRVSYLDLSRNFGKEIAMSAGLDYAKGTAVIIIDADLQDPPELIPQLIAKWKEGFDVVYAKRTKRQGETALKKLTAYGFYRVVKRISNIQIPQDTGDFRLLSRRAVDSLCLLREKHRFMKGLYSWIGYPQTAVEYIRDPRFAGDTKFDYWRLWNFAIQGITSFTIAPLKIATYIGTMTAIFAFIYGAFIVMKTFITGADLPGYPSLMVVILFLGGIQLVSIGIIGEYLGRTFDEVKNRPLYFVNTFKPAEKKEPE